MIKQSEITIRQFNVFYSNFEVNKDSKCWEYQKLSSNGYGRISIHNADFGTHRFSYILHNGDYEEGLQTCHTCDNPCCVNPDHLFVGTRSENMMDMSRKGRHSKYNSRKTHCKHGHEFTKENTKIENTEGHRSCRMCNRRISLSYYHKAN